MSTHEVDVSPVRNRWDLLSTAPWWLISAGIHVILLLVATLVYIERCASIDETQITIQVTPPRVTVCGNSYGRDIPGRTGTATPTEDLDFLRSIWATLRAREEAGCPDAGPNGREPVEILRGDSSERMGVRGWIDCPFPGDLGCERALRPASPRIGVGGGFYGGDLYAGRHCGLLSSCCGDLATPGCGGLAWLARHQSPDGSWKAAGFTDQCIGAKCVGAGSSDYDTGVTGLALLAYLGAGYTHLEMTGETPDPRNKCKVIRFKEVVKKAIKWLVLNQDADGCIGPKVPKMMYNHAIATLALCEAYGMTESQILKEPAQKAVDFLVAAKNPYRAWRYSPQSGENDTSVTGWCLMALKSASASNLKVPASAMHEALAWIDSVTDKEYGKVGYQSLEDVGTPVSIPGKNEEYKNHDALAAVGMISRIFVDRNRNDPVLAKTAGLLIADLPVWDKAKKTNDYYYWYYATLALYQYDGPDSGGAGKMWKPWNQAIKHAIADNQHKRSDGCAEGSWDADDRWGFEGGRVYATAINALTMEVYCRYTNVFGGQAAAKR